MPVVWNFAIQLYQICANCYLLRREQFQHMILIVMGLVENSNKQVKDQLRKFLSADKGNISNWSKWISYIQFNINNHINSRTNSSAFSLMFARQPNRFIDYSNQKLNLDSNKVINELLEMNKTKNEVVIPSIVERSTSIKEKNRLDLDKRRKQIPELLPGQKVMLFDD